MMQEVKNVSQNPGEPFRRWFGDNIFDLIVWHDNDWRITGFQLYYREGADQKRLHGNTTLVSRMKRLMMEKTDPLGQR